MSTENIFIVSVETQSVRVSKPFNNCRPSPSWEKLCGGA